MIGIYCIKNKINGKIYIGQSWTVEERWVIHKKNRTKKDKKNYHLYSSMRKYGLENFEFSILKEIIENGNAQKELDYFENFYINQFKSRDRTYGYNKKEGGSHGRHSKESNEKNRLAHLGKPINVGVPKSEETKRNMRLNHADYSGSKNPNFGKKASLETRLKISEKAKKRIGIKNPFFGKHHSEEFKKLSRERTINQLGHKIICHNNNKIYRSMSEAAIELKIDPVKISNICKGLIDDINFEFSFLEDFQKDFIGSLTNP